MEKYNQLPASNNQNLNNSVKSKVANENDMMNLNFSYE